MLLDVESFHLAENAFTFKFTVEFQGCTEWIVSYSSQGRVSRHVFVLLCWRIFRAADEEKLY